MRVSAVRLSLAAKSHTAKRCVAMEFTGTRMWASGLRQGRPAMRRWQNRIMTLTAKNSISVVVTKTDYIAAHRLHWRSSFRKTLGALFVFVLIAGALSLSGVVKISLALILFCAIGGFLGGWIQNRIFLPRKVAKLYDQFKNVADPCTVEWDAMHVSFRSPDAHSTSRWTDYAQTKEDSDVCLLYVTDALFQVIPKRSFGSPEVLSDFLLHAKSVPHT